jgi:hypothetical protein
MLQYVALHDVKILFFTLHTVVHSKHTDAGARF